MAGLNLRWVGKRGAVEANKKALIEQLEKRQLLSISGPSLAGPFSEAGTFWTYNVTSGTGESALFYIKAMGETTFNGVKCYELDEGSKLQAKQYVGLDSAGDYVEYANTSLLGTVTDTTIDSPYELIFPAQISANVPYTANYTQTTTDDNSDNSSSTSTEQDVVTLSSETPSTVTVTAGTYQAYTLQTTSTDTSDGTSNTTTGSGQFVPGIGYVQITSQGASYELVSFQDQPDHLIFSQQPSATAVGQAMRPAVTVSDVDPGGNVDANVDGSVTLTMASASRLTTYTGTLSGTLTEPLINGVATFSDLSVSKNGVYSLSATDTNNDPVATSTPFNIGQNTLQVEINDKVLHKTRNGPTSGVSPGDQILYSVLVEPLNNTIQDADLVVTFPTGFTPSGVTGGGTFSGNTVTWNVNTKVYNFDLTVPDVKTLNGLKAVTVSADDNVTYTDATTDEGTASNSEKIATVAALDFVQGPSNAVAGKIIMPPVTVAVKDIYGEVDPAATDTVTLAAKGGGKLSGTLSAVAVDGVATFANLSISKAGKYTLTANDTSNKKIKAAASDPFSIVSLLTIVGTMGGSKRISHDNTLDITDANSYTVAQSSDLLSLVAMGFTPNTASSLAQVKWDVERNVNDVATGVLPTISQTGPLNATVNVNQAMGSFNLICYYDSNSNGAYDSGEELRVYHLVEVGTEVLPGSSVVTSNGNFTGKAFADGVSSVVSGSFSGNHWAITTSGTVRVVGGGADGNIGLEKLHLGWVQNGIGDTFVVKYQNGMTASEQLKSGAFPVLDSTYLGPKDAIYGLTPEAEADVPPSPGPARDSVLGSDGVGGFDVEVDTADSPTVQFKTKKSNSDAVSTTGSNYFAEYLSAYSDDFSATYVGYYKVDWSAAFVFTRSSDGNYQDAGSSVQDVVTDLGSGTDLTALGVNIKGPKFNVDAIVK